MLCRSYSHRGSIAIISFFFFNDTATTEIYTLSLHDALPIWMIPIVDLARWAGMAAGVAGASTRERLRATEARSEEHTSELQSLTNLVCRLLLEKKNSVTLRTLEIGCGRC